jgi:hypothetical protein
LIGRGKYYFFTIQLIKSAQYSARAVGMLQANDVPIAVDIIPNVLQNGKTTLLFLIHLTEPLQKRRKSCLAKYRLKWLISQDLIRRTNPTKD